MRGKKDQPPVKIPPCLSQTRADEGTRDGWPTIASETICNASSEYCPFGGNGFRAAGGVLSGDHLTVTADDVKANQSNLVGSRCARAMLARQKHENRWYRRLARTFEIMRIQN